MSIQTSRSRTKTMRFFLGGISLAGLVALPLSANAAEYDGPEITFSQIYESPDDQELNLNYAKQQAAKGDYMSAAAALERMLFARPNSDSVRLFYALTLYRLDDRPAALRELAILENRTLTAAQQDQLETYKSNFSGPQTRQRASGFSGRIAVGMRYDDNAGNALADNNGLPLSNKSDIAGFAQATLRYSAPINAKSGTRFNAHITDNTRRHETVSRADYDVISGAAGLSGRKGRWIWSAEGQATQVYISGSKYLSQIGTRLRVGKSVSDKTTLWVSGALYDQNYKDLDFTLGETLRSGSKYVALSGASINLNATSTLNITAGYEDKKATNKNLSYAAFRAGATLRKEFSNGVYATAHGNYRKLNYRAVPVLNITPTERRDNHYYARLSGGTTLANIGQWIGANPGTTWDDLNVETALTYSNRGSNNPAFDYKNTGVEIRLVWNF